MGAIHSIPRWALDSLRTALILAVGLTVFSVYSARGDNHDATYWACLYAGSLSQVGTTEPANCGRGTAINWNQLGLEGPQGEPGNDAVLSAEQAEQIKCGALLQDGVDLSGCDLSNANLSGAKLANANLSNTNMTSTFIDGAGLSGANLQGADLTIAVVINVNLQNAILSGAVLRGTNLVGSTLTGAVLTGVTWDDTRCPDGTNSDSNGDTCVGHLVP